MLFNVNFRWDTADGKQSFLQKDSKIEGDYKSIAKAFEEWIESTINKAEQIQNDLVRSGNANASLSPELTTNPTLNGTDNQKLWTRMHQTFGEDMDATDPNRLKLSDDLETPGRFSDDDLREALVANGLPAKFYRGGYADLAINSFAVGKLRSGIAEGYQVMVAVNENLDGCDVWIRKTNGDEWTTMLEFESNGNTPDEAAKYAKSLLNNPPEKLPAK